MTAKKKEVVHRLRPMGQPRPMPTDFPISLDAQGGTERLLVNPGSDISQLMEPGSETRQGMQGFDDDYVDIVDYIVRSTHKIWEGRGVGLIYSHYVHNPRIHTANELVYGRFVDNYRCHTAGDRDFVGLQDYLGEEWTVSDEIAVLKQLYTPPIDSWVDNTVPF